MRVIQRQAAEYLESAVQAIARENYAAADRDLDYACEEWPDQCDLHRAIAYSQALKTGKPTAGRLIEDIRNSLNTFDEMVDHLRLGEPESALVTTWQLPVLPLMFTLRTRSQVRAAYAAAMVADGRYDESRSELDLAARERVIRPENRSEAEKTVAVVEALLYFRTSRWEDLITTTRLLCQPSGTGDFEQLCSALGNAMAGTALAHIGSHTAGQEKLRYAIEMNFSHVSAWASLQLGLSLRAEGNEDAAQTALSKGMQYATLPEITRAMSDRSITMRVSAPDVIAARTSFWDVTTEPDVADYQRQSSQEDRREVLAEALTHLEAIDGMDAIKAKMRKLSSAIQMENEKRRRGMKVSPKTRHLIFKGPPGTGKTTIANLIAELYYGLGVIRSHNMVGANRAELIGSFEGESAKKTMAKLKEARGGVLFIDEAYELVQQRNGQADPYGSEALTTLLEYMDNHRDDMVLIIAGYEAPIERFLGENPGFKSRFADSISFGTYSGDEMWRIINGMAAKEGLTIDPSIEGRFKEIIDIMWMSDTSGDRVLDVAGNGRFARNVFEQAQEAQSHRMTSGDIDMTTLTDEELTALSCEDVLGAMADILHGFGITNL
ncbi:MAG: AAA family ATPase [Gordonia amarae]